MKSKPSDTSSKTNALRAELALVALGCAYEDINPHACPLRDIRDKSLKERMEWLAEASDEAIHNIYIFCRICWEAKDKLKQKDRT